MKKSFSLGKILIVALIFLYFFIGIFIWFAGTLFNYYEDDYRKIDHWFYYLVIIYRIFTWPMMAIKIFG